MNNLIMKKIYIFDLKDKKAFVQEFNNGINIITSSIVNGNNVGKSVIMKSLYHTLGADCYFTDQFDVDSKTFILQVDISNNSYYFIRFKNHFKIYDVNYNLLFETTTRKELSLKLKDLFNFYVELPNRITGELELTPPAFMYLLNYLDQDKMEGTKFASFRNLEQYQGFKEDVLYNYFGIFNQEYYDLKKSISEIMSNISNTTKELEIIESMLNRVNVEIGENNYSENSESLEAELQTTKEEYVEIVNMLNSSKSKLIKLQNSKSELEILIKGLNDNIKYENGILKKFHSHTCPICNSPVDDLEFKYKQYDRNEDYMFITQSVEIDLEDVKEAIEKEKNNYYTIIKRLNNYNSKISAINKNVDNVVKHKGYIEMRDKLFIELSEQKQKKFNLDVELSNENKKMKKYQEKKKEVKNEYYNSMLECANRFELKEIDTEKLKDIKNNFYGSGSNKPICTIIWYLNLLKLKEKFNTTAILFPLVLDSPNNGELSDESRKVLFEYIFENYNKNSQLIISTLGFNIEDYSIEENINVLNLVNPPYQLLNEEDYKNNIEEYKKIIGIE